MNKKIIWVSLAFCTMLFSLNAQTKKPVINKNKSAPVKAATAKTAGTALKKITAVNGPEKLVEIVTNYGTMVAKLYNSTPLHRDNFIKLVKEGFYDSLLFHRVINQFMIQGGDPNSKGATETAMLGNGSAPGERIPAEFKPMFFHKKGALAAARDNNAEKASSNCQFYIVQGKPQTDAELDQIKKSNTLVNYNDAQMEIYKRIGGSPFLDQNYTVFGEVISGLEVIDRITKVNISANNRPQENVVMKMRLLN